MHCSLDVNSWRSWRLAGLIGSILRATVMMSVCFVSVACSNGPPVKLYILEPVVDAQPQAKSSISSDIGLAVVKVPGYTSDERIASRIGRTRIELSDDHQWAESPDEAITRVLANRMRAFTGGSVIVEPLPRGFDPQARVEFDFDKLLRDERGGAEVSGQLRIISGDGRDVLAVRSFQVVHDASGMAREDYFAALSRAINDIARLALFTLQNLGKPT